MIFVSDGNNEATHVLDKLPDILDCALGILPKVRQSHDVCLAMWGPSAVLGNSAVNDAYHGLYTRGAKIRLITEISDANLDHCKQFMKIAEVRHLDKVKGNFSVSDTKWYTASPLAEKDKPPSRLIFSTVKEIVEQHQYFFETLWAKAVPAAQRIQEIEGKVLAERTEIIYGQENSLNLLLQVMARTKKEAVACSSAIVPVFCMTVEPAKQAVIDAKERGVKPRQITEITKDNLTYCKEFMKYVELRHMSDVQGNMLVTDNDEYVATASLNPSSVAQGIYSNAKTIIEQQRLFFENLWNKSIPAEQRIREIEEGIESINLEILSSNQESGTRGLKLVQDAKNEVLVLFPSPHVLDAALGLGIADLYNHAARRGVAIKILVQTSKDSQSMLDAAKKKLLSPIQIRTIQDEDKMQSESIKMSILVADNKEVIVWNMLEGHTNDLYQMAGNAIYSSNSSVVSSYHAIFTSLWKQVEMYERIIAHEEMQKDFINIAAHELRTPIQPLLGTADLLESQLDSKGEVKVTKDEIDMIIRNARRLERLSSDILTLSRIETGSLQLFKETTNLGEKIGNVIADAKAFAKDNKALEIIYEPPVEPIIVNADKSKLFEVLSNLIKNAIKFTEQGAITVTLEKDGSQAVVSIKDSGIGIDAEIMPRLFEKFATKSDQGTGLGLYISKSIVEAHGGRIWAKNNPNGKGATFSFSLPI